MGWLQINPDCPVIVRFIYCYKIGFSVRMSQNVNFSSHISQQDQQRVAVGPGNVHLISICHVSSDAATLRLVLPPPPLLYIGNLMIRN